jgi:hypothetical protein
VTHKEVVMAASKACKEERPALEAYADEQYRKFLKEKDQYISLDDYCSQRDIE